MGSGGWEAEGASSIRNRAHAFFRSPASSGADALRSSAALEFWDNSVAGFSHKLSVTYALQTVS